MDRELLEKVIADQKDYPFPWDFFDRSQSTVIRTLYYNAQARANAVDRFNEKLLEYKEEVESGKLISEH